jgi:hypothetical protein
VGRLDGILYLANRFRVDQAGAWTILLGHDGGAKLFVDGKAVLCEPRCVNPARPDRSRATVRLGKGVHEIVVALDLAGGKGWGIFFRFAAPTGAARARPPAVVQA